MYYKYYNLAYRLFFSYSNKKNYWNTSKMMYNSIKLKKERNGPMNIYRYTTNGGKDLILDYINKLPKKQEAIARGILKNLQLDGLDALEVLNTRQLRKKLWEIKFFDDNRLMYVVADDDNFYILHACKKQKGKAEKFELDTAIDRAKELGRELGKSFV